METQDSGIIVLMPTFNQGAFISRTIASLKAQKFQRRKLIVIDDGSADIGKQLRDNLWRQRLKFCFDTHADELIAFFRQVIAQKAAAQSDQTDSVQLETAVAASAS